MGHSPPHDDSGNDALLNAVDQQVRSFKKEARKHKRLWRALWFGSSLISLLIAFLTNFSFDIPWVSSDDVAAGLAILLPVISGYIVLRSPEPLWIHEVVTRNKLADLETKIRLGIARQPDFDTSVFDQEFFEIMNEASERWAALKGGASSPRIDGPSKGR
jgi:hypothetical protein